MRQGRRQHGNGGRRSHNNGGTDDEDPGSEIEKPGLETEIEYGSQMWYRHGGEDDGAAGRVGGSWGSVGGKPKPRPDAHQAECPSQQRNREAKWVRGKKDLVSMESPLGHPMKEQAVAHTAEAGAGARKQEPVQALAQTVKTGAGVPWRGVLPSLLEEQEKPWGRDGSPERH